MAHLKKQVDMQDSMPLERWLPVPDFEDQYLAGDWGHVWSIARLITRRDGSRVKVGGQLLRVSPGHLGHGTVALTRPGRRWNTHVHVVVLTTFAGPRPSSRHEGCHWDGDSSNNRLENLRWDTISANQRDSVRHGRNRLALRTHCSRCGAEYTPENTYVQIVPRADGSGDKVKRSCRACRAGYYARVTKSG